MIRSLQESSGGHPQCESCGARWECGNSHHGVNVVTACSSTLYSLPQHPPWSGTFVRLGFATLRSCLCSSFFCLLDTNATRLFGCCVFPSPFKRRCKHQRCVAAILASNPSPPDSSTPYFVPCLFAPSAMTYIDRTPAPRVSPAEPVVVTGGCYCKKITYALRLDSKEDVQTTVCHCKSCKKTFGSVFGVLVKVPVSRVRMTGGRPVVSLLWSMVMFGGAWEWMKG